MVADLHCHTKLSDSSMGIDDLIALAQKRGVEAVAITDRDCQAGIIRAKMAGERKGIAIIPGVEISCYDEISGKYCSILGYSSDCPDRLEGLCHKNLLAKKRAIQKSIIRIAKKYPITQDLITKCAIGATAVYEQHIMHALFECGLTDRIYGDLYNELFNEESIDNVIEKPLYASPIEVVNAIHDAGGIAVMSAPGKDDSFDILDELLDNELDGIEVWSPFNTQAQTEKLIKTAAEHDLLTTGGTCFMGMYSKTVLSVGDIVTNESCMKLFTNYKTKMKKKKNAAEKNNAK